MNKTTSSLIEPNQKLRNLEQEKAQAEHRSQHLQNRERYLSEGARKKRTHHLCNMGGAIEALCPQAADPSLTVCGTACDCAKPPKTQSIQGLNGCYFIEDVTKKVPKSQNFGTLT